MSKGYGHGPYLGEQQKIIETRFTLGQRVEVVYQPLRNGFARVEAECRNRPGWYWVRYPDGQLDMVQWVYLLPT